MIYLTSYLFEEVGTIRTIYIILYLLTVIFAFLVSFYITKVIYKPIASLINIFGGDVMTSYDEFAFLSQEARKNLNINNDLILELDNIKRERKYKFLYDLLNGFVWGDGISKSINQYNLLFLCNRCNVVMFEFRLSSASSSSDGFYVIDGYTSLLYLELEKILKDKILEKWIDDENRAICIIADVEDLEDDINNVVENMSKKEVFVVAAISNIIDNPQEYRNVYDSLSRLLKYSFVVGKNVLTQERDEIYSAWEYYTIEQESQLEEFIINGQYEKALFILRRILSGFRYDRELKEDDEYKFKTMIVLNTIRFLKQSGLKLLKIENDLLNLRENVTIDRNDFCEEMLGVYKNIIKGFDINAENSNQIGEQIVEYLKQNYMKDISMDDVCDMFGVPASTVTRKLDEMYGIKFKTYLTELRIEKAKKIIKTNPAYKIKDIAEQVGFNNALSFGRAFNRVEGISVGDYIKRIK